VARKEAPALKIINIPADLCVGADYGLLVRKDASAEGWRLAMYILSSAGQKILGEHGFEAVAIRKGE
jgi:molybdate transport system substrate-binding protein